MQLIAVQYLHQERESIMRFKLPCLVLYNMAKPHPRCKHHVYCRLLNFWRRAVSPQIKSAPLFGRYLDAAMEWLWPSPTREPHLATQDGLTGTIDNLARNITAGLSLPFIAYAVGIIFKSVVHDHTKRILLVSSCSYWHVMFSSWNLPVDGWVGSERKAGYSETSK
jgi:hypothetical protein